MRRFAALIFVFLAFAGVGALSIPVHPHPTTAVEPPLTIEPTALDFGEVWSQMDFSVELPIHNRSSEEVTITGFRTSLCCI
jgi:hypothetical protein